MKKYLYILSLIAFTAVFFTQCDSEDNLMTGDAKEGGLMDIVTPALNYVVGNTGEYKFTVKIYQGPDKITKIKFYKSFYSVLDDTVKGKPWSNEVLETTIDITNMETHSLVSPGYSYAALIKNLTLNGKALPANDGNLSIGDAFYFRVVSETTGGREVEQATKVKMTVATRFAGKYKPIAGEYYRIGVSTYGLGDWPSEVTVESVDAITYKMTDFEPFLGNTLYFQIDGAGKITYPEKWKDVAQIINDQPIITCEGSPVDMITVHCAESNYIVKDDVNGKDKLYQSYGYYTAGSGPRTFYQVLEKIVE
jgi:hypothetical protein